MAQEHSPKNKEWKAARVVWSTANITLPVERGDEQISFLDGLLRVALTYRAAKEATEADRTNKTDLMAIADQCRDLSSALAMLDPAPASRLAGATIQPLNNLLTDAFVILAQLETALRRSRQPIVRRKKPNEHMNVLVELLATVYERHTGKRASVYTNRTNNKRVGRFVEFVNAFNTQFLSGEISDLNARAIQRALTDNAGNPPPASL